MYVYVSHYFWIVIAANIFLNAKLDLPTNTFVLLLFAEILMFLTFLGYLKLSNFVKKCREGNQNGS